MMNPKGSGSSRDMLFMYYPNTFLKQLDKESRRIVGLQTEV